MERCYKEVSNLDALYTILEQHLQKFNSQHENVDMVISRYAIEHICRMMRIIRQPHGNALLVCEKLKCTESYVLLFCVNF